MLRQLILRLALGAITAVVAAVMVIIAVVFLCVGFYLLLQDYVSPMGAAFLTAAIALAFILVIVLLAKVISAAFGLKSRRQIERRAASAAEIGNLVGRRVGAAAGRNAPLALAVSLAAGFFLGVSPRLRSLLLKALRF
jgi:hypothetical protein